MKRQEFSNGLRLLHGIDAHELVGVPLEAARAFVADPVRQFIRADDAMADAIWEAMEARTRPALEHAA